MSDTQTYRYEAITAQGQLVSGQIDAPDEPTARDQLRQLALSRRSTSNSPTSREPACRWSAGCGSSRKTSRAAD
jgi:type II secretory pathway component PulF